MRRVVRAGLIAMGIAGAAGSPLLAARQPQGSAPGAKPAKVTACSLLTREEVKKLAPWPGLLDQIPTEEDSIGATGSGCNYPGVHIQLLPFSPNWFVTIKKRGKVETLAGVGDEAYFYANPQGYAEIYAKVGPHLLTFQKSVGAQGTMESARAAALALAKAAVAKLR